MFGKNRKDKTKKNEELKQPFPKKSGNSSKRPIWGIPCDPEIHGRMKMLADRLQVPDYALTEYALKLSVGLIARLVEDQEDFALIKKHVESHIGLRTIEKITAHDQVTGDILYQEWRARSRIDRVVRQIVDVYVKRGLKPENIPMLLDVGLRTWKTNNANH